MLNFQLYHIKITIHTTHTHVIKIVVCIARFFMAKCPQCSYCRPKILFSIDKFMANMTLNTMTRYDNCEIFLRPLILRRRRRDVCSREPRVDLRNLHEKTKKKDHVPTGSILVSSHKTSTGWPRCVLFLTFPFFKERRKCFFKIQKTAR